MTFICPKVLTRLDATDWLGLHWTNPLLDKSFFGQMEVGFLYKKFSTLLLAKTDQSSKQCLFKAMFVAEKYDFSGLSKSTFSHVCRACVVIKKKLRFVQYSFVKFQPDRRAHFVKNCLLVYNQCIQIISGIKSAYTTSTIGKGGVKFFRGGGIRSLLKINGCPQLSRITTMTDCLPPKTGQFLRNFDGLINPWPRSKK